jgi:hypothetical protein
MSMAQKDIAIANAERDHPSPSRVQVVADHIATHQGPVVAHIHLRAPLRTDKSGEKGVATFPVPAFGDGQVPIAFKVTCDAPGKLLGYSWRKRQDGRNMVCDVILKPGTKGVWLQYDALVLIGGPNQHDMTAPDKNWTSSTACVQSDASPIQAVAKKLAAPGDTDEAFAQKVFKFVRDDMGKGAPDGGRYQKVMAAAKSGKAGVLASAIKLP